MCSDAHAHSILHIYIFCHTAYSACGIKASNGEYLLTIPKEAKVRDAKVKGRVKGGPDRPRNIRGGALCYAKLWFWHQRSLEKD